MKKSSPSDFDLQYKTFELFCQVRKWSIWRFAPNRKNPKQCIGYAFDEEGNEIFSGSNVTYRATYLIDEEGKIFHESVNDMPLGRNVKEFLRLIDAYTHVQKHGEVCPANWEEGKDAMKADRNSTAKYLATHKN